MRTLRFALALLFFGGSIAQAATLSVVADQATYNVGDTVTVTVTGDTQGAFALLAFGRLLFDNPSVIALSGATPTQSELLFLGSIPWTTGVLSCGTNYCDMINQITALGVSPSGSTVPVIATVSFVMTGVGPVNITWETAPNGFQLDFFGLTNAPGTSFGWVPEPASGLLLGAGLAALAAGPRSRYTP